MSVKKIPLDLKDDLRKMHVSEAWFLKLELPSGDKYYHDGCGNPIVPLDGVDREWRGVTDPEDDKLARIDQFIFPDFNIAASFEIALTSIDKPLYADIAANHLNYEGVTANVFFGIFNPETMELKTDLIAFFPGKLTSPTLKIFGARIRECGLKIASLWESGKFPFGARWTDANHQSRHAGDPFFQYVGVRVNEAWK